MTQCEFCEENLWNKDQIKCSGGQCSSAYEIAQDMGIEFDGEDE